MIFLDWIVALKCHNSSKLCCCCLILLNKWVTVTQGTSVRVTLIHMDEPFYILGLVSCICASSCLLLIMLPLLSQSGGVMDDESAGDGVPESLESCLEPPWLKSLGLKEWKMFPMAGNFRKLHCCSMSLLCPAAPCRTVWWFPWYTCLGWNGCGPLHSWCRLIMAWLCGGRCCMMFALLVVPPTVQGSKADGGETVGLKLASSDGCWWCCCMGIGMCS